MGYKGNGENGSAISVILPLTAQKKAKDAFLIYQGG
jgi:hypothetical protein